MRVLRSAVLLFGLVVFSGGAFSDDIPCPGGALSPDSQCVPSQTATPTAPNAGMQTPTITNTDAKPAPETFTNSGPQGASETVPPAGQSNRVEAPRRAATDRLPPVTEHNEFQDFVTQSLGRVLPLYGYDLFRNVPSTFAPVDHVPVTPDYVIGPGDEVLIRAWGQIDVNLHTTVDRNGNISIPKVGDVTVAGLRYKDLSEFLRTAIGRVFRNFDLNVTLGQLRSVQIFVVGQARRPGAYTVGSMSTLVNAVFASGGPSVKGSMRHIQLKRNDRVVTELDLYDLLARGDKSKDAQLLPGDVIYIPPIGGLVAIDGSVNVPAIYELRDGSTLDGLIKLAGGLTATAAGQKVTVERIVDHKQREVLDIALDKSGLDRELRDGDLVRVAPLSARFENAVTLKGNVAMPLRYPWHEGLRVKDLIPERSALITPDYWLRKNAAILVKPVNQPALRDGQDSVSAGSRASAGNTGNRDNAGNTGGYDGAAPANQTTLRNEVKRSLKEINWDYAVVERLNWKDLTTNLIPFNLGKAVLDADPANNILLEPGDVVTVFSKDDIKVPEAKQSKFVRLEGEIKTSGVYKVEPGETLRQLVARVGGLTPNAYLFGAEFTRESTRELQQKAMDSALNRFELEIEQKSTMRAQNALSPEDAASLAAQMESQRALLKRLREVKATGRVVLEIPPGEGQLQDVPDIVLEDGDRLYVPARSSMVSVIGAVYNENSFIYRRGKRVSDYLSQAGGATRDADSDNIYVIRADGSVASKQQASWFMGFGGERLMPGDTIVVPQQLDKTTWVKEAKDWTQILYQFGIGAAAVKVLK